MVGIGGEGLLVEFEQFEGMGGSFCPFERACHAVQ